MDTEHKPELVSIIRQQIDSAGGITFSEFMQQALYHPEYGYYTSRRQRIGKQGDFFTSSSVHSCFGRLIARQLVQMWHILGEGHFTIAEQGAGEGHLCLDILDALAAEAPEFYASLEYRLVELSPDNRQRQRELLSHHHAAGKVSIGLDYFDASLNRIGAYVTGTRAMQKALLIALLEPRDKLLKYEETGKYFERMALMEELKTKPFGAVWDYYCLKEGVPVAEDYIYEVQQYETKELLNRK